MNAYFVRQWFYATQVLLLLFAITALWATETQTAHAKLTLWLSLAIGLLVSLFIGMHLQRRILLEGAQQMQQQWVNALDIFDGASVLFDHQLKPVYINPAFKALKLNNDEHYGCLSLLSSATEQAPNWQQQKQWQGEIKQHEISYQVQLQLIAQAALQPDSQPKFILLTCQDLTGSKDTELAIEHLILYDSVTQLPNRHLFEDRVKQALAQLQRHKKGFALLALNIDRFRRVNEALNHDKGDELLNHVGLRLQENLRSADTAARIGADEFAILLEDVQHSLDASRIANKLLQALKKPLFIADEELQMTASIGICFAPEDSHKLSELTQFSALAMQNSKREGGDRFSFYQQHSDTNSRSAIHRENELRGALANDEFILEFQPQLHAANGEMLGVETLVRWQHPQKGKLGPLQFIDLAEETGLIIPLGEWILANACKQIRSILDLGITPFKVAVNISPRQFRDPNLLTCIQQALFESRLEPYWLELEITEGVLMENIEHTATMLGNLKQLGLSLSIDDFGTGYSSLAYLKKLPVDCLKIDKSFVDGIPDSQDDQEIISAVISMAHQLGLEVVAEGVENIQQVNFLQNISCDLIQGYYYSKPIAAQSLPLFLSEHAVSFSKNG